MMHGHEFAPGSEDVTDAGKQLGENTSTGVSRGITEHRIEGLFGDPLGAIGRDDGSIDAGRPETALGARRGNSIIVTQPHVVVANSASVRPDGAISAADIQYPVAVFDRDFVQEEPRAVIKLRGGKQARNGDERERDAVNLRTEYPRRDVGRWRK